MSKIVKKQIRELTIVNANKITQKNKEIVNKYCEKVLKLGYDKRVIKAVNGDCRDTVTYERLLTNQSHDITAQLCRKHSLVHGSMVVLFLSDFQK